MNTMRHIVKFSLSLLLIAGLIVPATAQKSDFAHVNTKELLQMMPGIKEADKELKEYTRQLQEQSQNMMQDYQKKVKEYEDKKALMNESVKEVKKQEIKDMEKRLQSFRKSARKKVQDKKKELYGPILKKAENAIKKVAKEEGYAYVFDTSAGGVVYAQESDNIMPLVKQELGLQ